MLQLNHANLPVEDVAALSGFFVRHFGFRVAGSRDAGAFVMLRGEDGFLLNVMKDRPGGGFPRNFHVGFLVESAEIVRTKHDELSAAGVEVGPVEELSRGGGRSVTFYCHAPSGILVEVGCEM